MGPMLAAQDSALTMGMHPSKIESTSLHIINSMGEGGGTGHDCARAQAS